MTPYGHIDMRVRDLAAALPFYEKFLPELGFVQPYHSPHVKVWATRDPLPAGAFFAISEDPAHVANANRVAFWAADREAVDRLSAVVREAGGAHVDGPSEMPYGPNYYAVYFDDPSGNRFEIYCRVGG